MTDSLDPQQIQQLTDSIENLTKTLGGESTLKKADIKNFDDLGKALKSSLVSYNGLNKAILGASSTLGKLKDGAHGAAQFNEGIDAAGSAITKFAGILAVLVGGPLGLFVAGIGLAVTAGKKYVEAVNKQSDALFKTYQDLSKSGLGGTGMQQIFTNMQKFGYGIQELGEMTALLQENATALARFGGTAQQGANAFADLSNNIIRNQVGKELMRMGKTVDEINRGGAGYIKTQIAIGRNSDQINKDITASTVKYIKELDALSRLTGDNREAQEAKLQAALAEEAYNQTIYELDQKARRGDKQAEAQRDKLQQIMLSDIPEDLKKELQRAIGGDVAAAQKLQMTAPTFYQKAMDQTVSMGETMDTLTRDLKRVTEGPIAGLARYNIYGETFGDLKSQREYLAAAGDQEYDTRIANAKSTRTAQDQATKDQVELRMAQMNTRDALQSMLQQGIIPVTRAMSALAGVTAKAAGLPGAIGGGGFQAGGGRNIGGGGYGPGGNFGNLQGAGGSNRANMAMQYFMAQGYTKAQAAGIVGNLQAESGKNLDINAVGDSGKARGLAQWHPDRQANFAKFSGKDIGSSTFEDQLAFIKHELETSEAGAGAKLKGAGSAQEAAAIIDQYYERSSGAARGQRMANAAALAGPNSGYQNTVSSVSPGASLPTAGAANPNFADTGGTASPMVGLLSSMNQKLDILNRVNQQQLGVQQKQLTSGT